MDVGVELDPEALLDATLTLQLLIVVSSRRYWEGLGHQGRVESSEGTEKRL